MFTKDSRRGDKFKKSAQHFNVIDKDRDRDINREPINRKLNKQIARETFEILENQFYVYSSDNDNDNEEIIVKISLNDSLGETFTPQDLNLLCKKDKKEIAVEAAETEAEVEKKAEKEVEKLETEFTIIQTTIVDAIHKSYVNESRLAVLNFASAKNPGGGFLKGSDAQEESLARASGLYYTIKDSPMYSANEKDNRKCLYQEYLIYSSNVPVFRDLEDQLIKNPIYVDIISVPAVNEKEAFKKDVSKSLIDQTRFNRINNFLAVLKSKNIKHVILGAWGCGVFGGDFTDLASDYYSLLIEGHYKNVFERVIFAVLNEKDASTLEDYFN